MDKDTFFEQFKACLRKQDRGFKASKVIYYNEKFSDHPMEYEKYKKDPFQSLFYKRSFFEFQNEYRIALQRTSKDDVLTNIGDIKDITTILSVEQIRNMRIIKKVKLK